MKFLEFKFATHSVRTLEQLKYVITKGMITPRRAYWYLPVSIYGLSVNGVYAYANRNCYMVHFVFPWKVVRDKVRPVFYHPYSSLKSHIPSSFHYPPDAFYLPDVLAADMELVGVKPLPLSDVEEVYVSPGVTLKSEVVRKLREWGPVYTLEKPLDPETYRTSQLLLRDRRIVKEYNKRVAEEFNIDYVEPTFNKLLDLLRFWQQKK